MNTEQPLVSIIIPTYNRSHLIGETLDSILAQTYQNWECIVVDDGSTDTTQKVLQEYVDKDSRFQFFIRPTQMPKGANACRNYGFEKSKGKFIQWFDSDDIMHPEKLKLKLQYALYNKADVVVTTHTGDREIRLIENPTIETFESSEFYVDFILGKKPVITNDVLIKRSVVKTHRFDEKLHKAQEYEFFTRLFNQSLRYSFVDLPLVFYRETVDSISKQTGMGNVAQVESLIYLSKIIKKRHENEPLLVARAERQGRKTYKNLVVRKNLFLVYKHFTFFRKAFHKRAIPFFFYVLYNFLTGRGFYHMKSKKGIS